MDDAKKYPLVLIEWRDSFGCSTNWTEVGDLSPKALICRSVGWILYKDDDCHVIAPHLSDRNHDHTPQQACGDMTIPTQAIVRVTELKEI